VTLSSLWQPEAVGATGRLRPRITFTVTAKRMGPGPAGIRVRVRRPTRSPRRFQWPGCRDVRVRGTAAATRGQALLASTEAE
jgi:hypothetical protein